MLERSFPVSSILVDDAIYHENKPILSFFLFIPLQFRASVRDL
jgi:cell division inhibitor SulA